MMVEGQTTFEVDPDKICHWDLLGDIKELGYV